jgi:hypothetical protein
MAVKECGQALFTEPMCVARARAARQERETDRTVEIAEEPDRAGPEALEFAPQLVAQRNASLHEVLARGERPQRLGLVGVGLKDAEVVMIGTRQLAQHERVKPIRLAARGAERAAAAWFGWSASTRNPASSSRSINTPSGRSTATSSTFARCSARHSPPSPGSSWASVAASSSSPASLQISTSCFSDAQSTPA